jgi:hypothetical protein
LAILVIGCAFLAAGSYHPTSAAPPADKGQKVRVGAYEFNPLDKMPSLPQGLRHGGRDKVSYYIVQFADRITPEMRQDLDQTGAVALHYVHENAFIVRAGASALGKASGLPSVRWIGPYEPAYAMSPSLDLAYDEVLNKQMKTSGGSGPLFDSSQRIAVSILTMERDRVEDVAREAEGHGARGVVRSESGSGLVRAEIPRAALESLARRDGVLWIERELPSELFNDVARWTIQSFDSENLSAPVHQHGVTGAGQTVTISDSGADTDHTALASKITAYYTPLNATGDSQDNGLTQHGTHVSGSVAGDGGTAGQYDGDGVNSGDPNVEKAQFHDGQAFGALLNMQDISNDGTFVFPSSDLTTHYDAAVSHGSWINTNSWGQNVNFGAYTNDCVKTDDYIWNHPNFTVLFAEGNRGPGLNTTNPFASAKNLIAVGASGNGATASSPASFSSRGPTLDGRIKPDLMAPGVGLWSAKGCDTGSGCQFSDFNTYKQLSGTSMATPTVAGAAALVRQYYMGGWYPTGNPGSGTPMTPSAALIKATLINSTVEMNGGQSYLSGEERYPNNNQGWGRILLDNALYFPGDTRDLTVVDDPGVSTSQTKTFQLPVGNPFEPLKVTLVWSDRPRTAPTSPDLINDLDLVVTSPNGTVYRGNAFQGFNPGQSKPNALTSEADHLNNVENVLVISNLNVGLWTIQVKGNNVPQGNAQGLQPFALVMTSQQNRNFGVVALDKEEYLSTESANIVVLDANLNQNPNAVETTTVEMSSTTETTPEIRTLTETSINSGVFTGSIPLHGSATPIPGNGQLEVVNGNTITVHYFDANDGAGGSGTREDTATIDESAPVISSVTVSNLEPRHATITWTTDEPADSVVAYGPSFPLEGSASNTELSTLHQIDLENLTPGVTYRFQVSSTDEHGNAATDNNGGAYYTFLTPTSSVQPAPDWTTFQNNSSRQGVSGLFILPPLTPAWSVANNTGMVGNSSPVAADGLVFSAEGGYVRARDAATGSLFWETQLGDAGWWSSTPIVSGGMVYATIVTTIEDPYYGVYQKGFLYALNEYDGSLAWTYTRSLLGIDTQFKMALDSGVIVVKDQGDNGGGVAGVNASTGVEAWGFGVIGCTPSAGAAAGNGKIFVPAICSGGTGYLFAVDASTGQQAWGSLGIHFVSRVPVVGQGLVFLGESLSGSGQTATLHAWNADTGSKVWESTGFAQILSTPAYDGNTLYIATSNSQGVVGYTAIDSTSGDPVWTQNVSTGLSYASSSLVYANGYVYALTDNGVIRVLDALTGAINSTISVPEGTNAAHMAFAYDSIYVEGVAGTLYAFSAQEDPDDDNDGDPDVSDCAPLDPSRHNGATELCNGIDDDCVNGIDNGFPDSDIDGQADCMDPDDDNDGVLDAQDCAPTNPNNFPGNTEYCDNYDNDCDALVDEGFDVDGDLYKTCTGDCNDNNPAIHPGATEVCNLVDDDCDGYTDEAPDADGDGYSCANDCNDANPLIFGQESISRYASCFDNLDNDCDGVVDFDCAIDVGDTRTIIGSLTGLPNMKANSSDDVYESIVEGNPGKKAEIYLTFYNPAMVWWDLRTEAFRVAGNGDNFVLSKSIRTVAGKCDGTASDGTYSTGLTVSNTTDNDLIQFFQFGPPPGGYSNVAFCVRIKDSNQGSDNSADTLKLDKIYLMPILLHAKATSEIPGIGTMLNGTTYLQTQSSDGVTQAILEAGADEMRHTWRIPEVPKGYTHQLHIEGSRTHNTNPSDDFQFYYANPSSGVCPTNDVDYTIIPGAVVNVAVGGINADFPFGPNNTLVGTVCIRVRDTVPNGPMQERLNIDYLAIKTTP